MKNTETEQSADVATQLKLQGSPMQRRKLKGPLIWIAIIALVIAVAGIALIMRNGNDKVQYKSQAAERGNLVVTVSATGTLKPTNQVDVGSELSGIVKTVEVRDNDQVKVGQVLARLDTSKLESQVLQTRSALESAQAKVLQTKASVQETEEKLARFARVRELSGGRVPSQLEMDAAKAALERARADEAAAKAAVSQAQATLDVNLTDLSKAVIRSPINGVVLKRSVEPGQTVAASFQAPVLFTLAEDLAEMELHVNVDEADVGKVQSRQEATFTVDAYQDRSYPARISTVRFGSQTVEGVVTYETVLKVDNTDRSLRPGMTANAVITVNKIEQALLIPNAALRFSPPAQQQGGSSGRGNLVSRLFPRPPAGPSKQKTDENVNKAQKRVWILRNGQLEPVTVTTGATDGIMTEVTEGPIEPGTALVIDTVTGK